MNKKTSITITPPSTLHTPHLGCRSSPSQAWIVINCKPWLMKRRLTRCTANRREGNPSADAIQAGLEVLARIDRLVSQGRVPATRVGLGIHAGPAVVGNIGSAHRKEYTVIGDVVNVAARVEALNKELGSRLLVTESVWRAWQATGRTGLAPIAREPLRLRGREASVNVLQLA